MVHTAVREATLAVSDVTVAVIVALFSISCESVVCLVVAMAARLSKYPSRHVNMSAEIVASLPNVTVLAVPMYAFVPAVSS